MQKLIFLLERFFVCFFHFSQACLAWLFTCIHLHVYFYFACALPIILLVSCLCHWWCECCWLWAVPLPRHWRGVWWCGAQCLPGNGSRHQALMLNHPKSPSQPAAW